ncbi:MAG: hypothetical protein J6U96_05945 [Elusimicrobiaceae bacterium]|nr:hypothetical protein [Elusimicrobiaceae bacterium]
MKRTDYYRPSYSSLGRKKRVRKNKPLSILKPILLFIIFVGLCYGGYVLATKAYQAWQLSQAGKWTAEKVSVSGAPAELAGELQAAGQTYLNKPFSVQDAVTLQSQLTTRYPQLKHISVKRGLLSSTLKINVSPRAAVAKFIQDNQEKLLDEDGTIYTDPHPAAQNVPLVELVGTVPTQLGQEYVDLIQSALKLKKQLAFTRVQFNLENDTVKMYLPGEHVIDFGPAKQLRQKARRAAQITGHLPVNAPETYLLDFTYFDEGKVFLRQKAH